MGALMAYEGFDYPRGESLNGKAGGSGWSIPWSASATSQTVFGPGLTHSDIEPAIGNAFGVTSGTGLRYFSQDINPGTTEVWASVLMLRGAVGSGGSFRFVGPTGSETTPAMGLGLGSSSVPAFLTQATGGNAAGTVFTSQTFGVGNTDLFVMHIVPLGASFRVDLLLNPTAQQQDVAASITMATSTAFHGVFMAGVSGGGLYVFDEIRVGGSLEDVTAVPAPGFGVMFAAVAVWAPRRRR